MHDGDRADEPGQERGFFHGRVPAAHDGHVLITEEEAVTGGAPAHTPTRQPLLVRKTQFAIVRPHGENDRPGTVGATGAVDDFLDLVLETGLHDVVGDQSGTELLRLGPHSGHEVRSEHRVGKTRIVLHVGGVHQGATRGDRSLEERRPQLSARRVDRSGVSGRAGADDGHFLDCVTHIDHLIELKDSHERRRQPSVPNERRYSAQNSAASESAAGHSREASDAPHRADGPGGGPLHHAHAASRTASRREDPQSVARERSSPATRLVSRWPRAPVQRLPQ